MRSTSTPTRSSPSAPRTARSCGESRSARPARSPRPSSSTTGSSSVVSAARSTRSTRRRARPIWATETAGEIKGAVAYHDGVVFGSNYGGEFFAIDASDSGAKKWSTPIIGGAFGRGGGAYSTPAVAYGRVYVGAFDGRVYSLDEDTGDDRLDVLDRRRGLPGPGRRRRQGRAARRLHRLRRQQGVRA